jgi:hypothetical protein
MVVWTAVIQLKLSVPLRTRNQKTRDHLIRLTASYQYKLQPDSIENFLACLKIPLSYQESENHEDPSLDMDYTCEKADVFEMFLSTSPNTLVGHDRSQSVSRRIAGHEGREKSACCGHSIRFLHIHTIPRYHQRQHNLPQSSTSCQKQRSTTQISGKMFSRVIQAATIHTRTLIRRGDRQIRSNG